MTRGMGNIDPRRLGGDGGGLALVLDGVSPQREKKKGSEVPHLVERAQSDPTATMYLAGAQPTWVKASGRGLSMFSW